MVISAGREWLSKRQKCGVGGWGWNCAAAMTTASMTSFYCKSCTHHCHNLHTQPPRKLSPPSGAQQHKPLLSQAEVGNQRPHPHVTEASLSGLMPAPSGAELVLPVRPSDNGAGRVPPSPCPLCPVLQLSNHLVYLPSTAKTNTLPLIYTCNFTLH